MGSGTRWRRRTILLLLTALFSAGCRRGAYAPEVEGDGGSRLWEAPPGLAPPDAETVWLRRLIGDHHDWVAYLDEPAMAADPALQVVFERVRGRLQPAEQVVSVFALGGPGCSARGGCRDRLIVMAGDRFDPDAPVEEGWVLTDSVAGGDLYVPAEADEPLMFRFDRMTIIAHGFDAERVHGLLDTYGGPPTRVRLASGVVALRQFSGGYVFRADPGAGKGRGVVRSTTWLTHGTTASQNVTIYEVPELAAQAAQAVGANAPASVGEPSGQVLDLRGAWLVTQSPAVSFAEDLMRSQVAGSGGPARR